MTASTEGIGLGIAESLAKHGASVMISSRKEANVEAAVAKLRADGHEVAGAVCHVGKPEDRNKLLKVKYNSGLSQLHIFPFFSRKQSTGSEASIFWSPTLPSTLTLVSFVILKLSDLKCPVFTVQVQLSTVRRMFGTRLVNIKYSESSFI